MPATAKKDIRHRRSRYSLPIPEIEHIDGAHPSSEDIAAVQNSPCMNCSDPFSPLLPCFFVNTPQGRLWWHRHACENSII